MESDDIIYLLLLIFSIGFGYFFRQLRNKALKKWISTSTGFLIVLLVSGKHTLHPVICIIVNSLIILCISKRFCHIISFAFTFLYLIFFRTSTYFGISYAPAHTNLIQMMLTLKIVGLAFEVRDSHDRENDEKPDKTFSRKLEENISVNILDIVHYCFCHVGVLTGPYYSYRTFKDYHYHDFADHAPCISTTLQKLKFVPLYSAIFLLGSYLYPITYVDMTEFYTVRSFWYRLFYITPVFITFRMRIYVGLLLSECACTICGLGAYPCFTESRPGKGPTKQLDRMRNLEGSNSTEKTEYDFETVNNIDTWCTEFQPTVRSSIRYWNMCVQYWMAFIVYKRFPYKPLRTAATFAISAIWHGIYAGYFLCLGVVPVYLPIEDVWDHLLRKNATGIKKKVLDVLFWFVRTQAFSYMGMAFSLLTMERGLKYYGSVYYVYHITSVIALISGAIIIKLTWKTPSSKTD